MFLVRIAPAQRVEGAREEHGGCSLSELHPRSGLKVLSGRILGWGIPRVETLGFYEAAFVKARREKSFFLSFWLIFADFWQQPLHGGFGA